MQHQRCKYSYFERTDYYHSLMMPVPLSFFKESFKQLPGKSPAVQSSEGLPGPHHHNQQGHWIYEVR